MKYQNKSRRRVAISEVRLRKIIFEELLEHYMIQEGLWDDVKSGVKKLSAWVSKQFKQVAAGWAKAISEKLSQIGDGGIPDDAKKIMQALKTAMQKTGETFELDEGLQAAKELGKLGAEGALSIVQNDLEGPVHEKAKEAEVKAEGHYFSNLYSVLAEKRYIRGVSSRLNEALGVTAVTGIGLAIMGGLPMLFKGLYKLASKLGATGIAEVFHKAEKVTHHFEQKVVNFAMPFKLAHTVYLGLWKLGIKLTKGDEPYNEYEIKVEEDGIEAIKKAKGLVYKTLLIYFAINGVAGVLKAGASLLGFVEGTATAIKGVELAKGAAELAKIARVGSGGLAV